MSDNQEKQEPQVDAQTEKIVEEKLEASVVAEAENGTKVRIIKVS